MPTGSMNFVETDVDELTNDEILYCTREAFKANLYVGEPMTTKRLAPLIWRTAVDHDRARPRCRHCNVNLVVGRAMESTFVGAPDFVGDRHAATMSPGGAGRLVACMKCPLCGWSTT